MEKSIDIIFCMKAYHMDGCGISANGILPALNPEYIPGLYSFSVIITVLNIDTTLEHNMHVQFISPDKDICVEVKDKMPIISDNSNLPQEYKGINIAMEWNNINFKTSGLYEVVVSIDGNIAGSKKVFVKGKNE